MTKSDGFAFARPRHGDVGAALLCEYASNRNGIGVIYRALDVLVEQFELDDAALVVDGSKLGTQVFLAGRRGLGNEHTWLLEAEPGLYTSPKVKFDTSLLPVLCAVALDLDVEHHDAGHDALTGLANRRRIHDALDMEVRRAARTGSRFGVLAFDLVDFKRFNDRYGYDHGDEALRSFARALVAEARATDTVGRWGGDEFVLIALIDKSDEVEPLVRRVQERLAARPVVGDETLSFRGGDPVMYPDHAIEPGQILTHALGSLRPA
jgi:diguanylate cyclase (GGDEF)-like protein